MRVQHFDRHKAIHVLLTYLIDDTHAASTYHFYNLVTVSQPRSDEWISFNRAQCRIIAWTYFQRIIVFGITLWATLQWTAYPLPTPT
jgi:hypothetical protein